MPSPASTHTGEARTAPARRRGKAVLPAALGRLEIHATSLPLSHGDRDALRVRMGEKLGRFAPSIARVVVRFEDATRGTTCAVLCRVKVHFDDLPSVVVEERGTSLGEVFERASSGAARAVRRALGGRTSAPAPEEPARRRTLFTRGAPRSPLGTEGELIGRRVGQGTENLLRAADRPEKRARNVPVDTALPGVSATDRRAGGRYTARRNAKLNVAGMTSALEDSRSDRPTRKSTRKSADRAKRDSNLDLRTKREVASPGARARRAAADRTKVRARRAR